jgi:hypothetical protein
MMVGAEVMVPDMPLKWRAVYDRATGEKIGKGSSGC